MSLVIDSLAGPAAVERLAPEWNGLARDDAVALTGYDALSTLEWFDASVHAFPEGATAQVVTARRDGVLAGVLPVVRNPATRSTRHLLLTPELYGGRNGPVLDRPEPVLLAALLDGLTRAMPGWITLELTLLRDGAHERLLKEMCDRHGYRTIPIGDHESPYFAIPTTPEALDKQLAKDLRQRVRSGLKKLDARGACEFEHVHEPARVARLQDDILAVERGSWKQGEGSSITSQPRQQRFYEEMLPRAAAAGMLSAMTLRIDGRPVGYSMGLVHDRVFSCLKTSMDQAYAELAPAHAVRYRHLCELMARGVATYDFMGNVEPHKLRWTHEPKTYARRTWLVYSPGLPGHAAYWFKRGRDRMLGREARAAAIE